MKLPAVANATVAEVPGWIAPASKLPAEVAVWACLSLLVHTTEPPTEMLTVAGVNVKSAIPTAPAPVDADPEGATVVAALGATDGVGAAVEAVGAVTAGAEAAGVVAEALPSLEQAPATGSRIAARSRYRFFIATRSEQRVDRIGKSFDCSMSRSNLVTLQVWLGGPTGIHHDVTNLPPPNLADVDPLAAAPLYASTIDEPFSGEPEEIGEHTSELQSPC